MIISPLKQRHVEAFLRECREQQVDPVAPLKDKSLGEQVEAIGIVNRAAAHAGILNGADPDDLEMWQTAQLAADILNAVWASFSNVPKVSSSPQPITLNGSIAEAGAVVQTVPTT